MLKLLKSNKVLIFALLYSLFFFSLWMFFRVIPSVDTAENFFWGKEFQAGYYKHPPLFALISGVFGLFMQDEALASNIISGIFLFVSIISLYFFAREFLPEEKSFLSIILLVSFSVATIKFRTFNANISQIPFWILAPLFYIYGVNTKKALHFILCGFFLGLGFLSKYYTLILGFAMFVSFISNKQTRGLLKTSLPYLLVVSFLITVFPHIYWLFKVNFLPFEYVKGQQQITCSFLGCRKYALFFTLTIVGTCIPLAIYLVSIFKNFKFKGVDFKNYKESLLFCISVLPSFVTISLFAIMGGYVAPSWSIPLFFYFPIFVLYFWSFEKRANFKKRLSILFFFMLIVWTIITIASGIKDKKVKGERYETIKQIALFHTQNWEDTFGIPLKYIAGDTLDAGIFYLFSSVKPTVIPNNELKYAPFIEKEDVKKNGVLILLECKTEEPCFELKENEEIMEVQLIKERKNSFYLFIIYRK